MMQNKHSEFETDNNKLEEEMLVVLVTDLQEKHTAESSAIQKMIEIQVNCLPPQKVVPSRKWLKYR